MLTQILASNGMYLIIFIFSCVGGWQLTKIRHRKNQEKQEEVKKADGTKEAQLHEVEED